jgi:hypothetical protein
MKWIAHFKPIQFNSGGKFTTTSLMSNAYYAVISGLMILKIKEKWGEDKWWRTYVGNLTYLLYYHSPSAEQLASEMFVLDALKNAKANL